MTKLPIPVIAPEKVVGADWVTVKEWPESFGSNTDPLPDRSLIEKFAIADVSNVPVTATPLEAEISPLLVRANVPDKICVGPV